nr:MAG: ORF1 [Torque teno midi virus]
MPFWWPRRRRYWWGRRRFTRRFKKPKRRRRRRRFPRRRNRRFTRRRYKRKHKVRRKLKKINIQQWQPDSIKKCKIKGFSFLVLGANGRQSFCTTNQITEYPIPKAPGGGGFGCETINLDWLYKEYLAHNNIWTASNNFTDLCRYSGCKITFYRHPYVDFVINYERQPPFTLNKYTYPEIQPQNMLLAKHKKVLLSHASRPNGRNKLTLKIGPPKQMSTKWFFQKEFSPYHLLRLSATAASFQFPRYPSNTQGNILTVYALDIRFYHNSDWVKARNGPYLNIQTAPAHYYFKYYNERGVEQQGTYTKPTTLTENDYYKSINYTTGLFQTGLLRAFWIRSDNRWDQPSQAELPIIPLRYNPNIDHGFGNEIYLCNLTKGSYDKPIYTPNLQFNNVPLWMGFFGLYDFIIQNTNNKGVYLDHMFVVKCDALKPIRQATEQRYYPLIDRDFAFGKLPWDEYLDANSKKLWYPTADKQIQTINDIVCTGPYVPKFYNKVDSTWELPYKYTFFFKWGGPQTGDPHVEDPKTRNDYPVPDKLLQTVQVSNPQKLHTDTILHEWDYRRGLITSSALKRMSENLQIDTDFESDISESPKKKQKISKELPCSPKLQTKVKESLLSLCEEPTCQEQPENLQHFIQQQQQQQQQLKRNILNILTHLKKQQMHLQLQTGNLD